MPHPRQVHAKYWRASVRSRVASEFVSIRVDWNTGIDFQRVFKLIQGGRKKIVSTTNEVAVIKTSEGEMTIGFWPDVAPKTVENFKKLARDSFYDGTAFHRIVKG